MKYFDTHTHTNYEPLDQEYDIICKENIANDLYINIVGCDIQGSKLALQQANQCVNSYCSIAVHPECANIDNDIAKWMNELEEIYRQDINKKIIAIGECGLDYYYKSDEETKIAQDKLFRAHIELAHKLNLPIMLHIRDAHYDAYKIISQYQHYNLTWIIHCFSGTLEDMQNYASLNCYMAVGGAVTFKNNDNFREVVKQIPLHLLLTETDAPWLTPVPYRGKTNYPKYLINTNEYIAKLRNLDINEFNAILISNVRKVFNI